MRHVRPDYDANVLERFWEKVDVGSPDECWEWTASVMTAGYGQLTWKPGDKAFNIKAHRMSWEIHRGPIPGTYHVCHHCDNKRCVNPKHLFLGRAADNMKDMVKKGRQAKGEKSGSAKLTEKDVKEILDSDMRQVDLAAQYSVSQSTVSYIKQGKRWRHLSQ